MCGRLLLNWANTNEIAQRIIGLGEELSSRYAG